MMQDSIMNPNLDASFSSLSPVIGSTAEEEGVGYPDQFTDNILIIYGTKYLKEMY